MMRDRRRGSQQQTQAEDRNGNLVRIVLVLLLAYLHDVLERHPRLVSVPVISRRLRALPSWHAYSYRIWPSSPRMKALYEMVHGCVNTCGSVMVAS